MDGNQFFSCRRHSSISTKLVFMYVLYRWKTLSPIVVDASMCVLSGFCFYFQCIHVGIYVMSSRVIGLDRIKYLL